MLSTVLRLALFAWVFLLAPSSRAQQFEVVVQTGVRGRVQPVAFDPQGRFFVTEENDRFKLWDTRTLMELLSYPRNATDLGFALGGSRLIALLISKEERAIRAWNTATSEVAFEIPIDSNTGPLLACSEGKRFAFVQGWDLVVYDAESGQQEKQINSQGVDLNFAMSSMAMTRDGRRVGVRVMEGIDPEEPDNVRVAVFDVDSGALLWSDLMPGDDAGKVCFSSDGKWLAAAGAIEVIAGSCCGTSSGGSCCTNRCWATIWICAWPLRPAAEGWPPATLASTSSSWKGRPRMPRTWRRCWPAAPRRTARCGCARYSTGRPPGRTFWRCGNF